MKVLFVRGAFLNNFEGQNYPENIIGYSSLFPLDDRVQFPLVRLMSLADLQKVPLLNLPIRYIANRTLGDSQILLGLEKYIEGSDIVHVGDPHYYYSYQAARLREKGRIKKLVCTWWETIPFNNESTHAKKKIKRYTIQHTDMFVCYSKRAQSCMVQEGIPENKITIIPLGVDLDLFKPIRKKRGDVFTLLFVGRLVKEKGILDVYNVLKAILLQEKKVRLRIVGDGPLKKSIQDMIQKDGLGEIVTIETRSYWEMPQVYRSADALFIPSKRTATWEEQYGMVFVEAMASGIPIVSTATGAIGEVVGGAGLLAKEGDTAELVTLIIRIIRVRELGAKLGTIGRERAKKFFDAKKTKERLQNLYRELL